MATAKNDPLFDLIKSLSKTEKRHFRLFVGKSGNTEDLKFLKLFDAMESMKTYDDQVILKKVPAIKKIQFSNQKANLYRQILASLRQYHIGQNPDMQIRELLDHAKVLYNKGFYKQALKILDKAKNLASQNQQHAIKLEVLEFEKLIESQYITRSIENRAEQLGYEVDHTTKALQSSHSLSNLTLNLYSLFLKNGYARTEEEFDKVKFYFNQELPKVELAKLSFQEKLHFHQAHVWYNKIVQNFPNVYKHALAWVNLFKKNEDMAKRQNVHFIKGYSNLLDALFQLQFYTRFCEVLKEVESLKENKLIVNDLNTNILIFKFLYISKINKHFMEGSFKEAAELIPEIEAELEHYKGQIDPERILMFYYKFASIYFGAAHYRKCIFYLNKIIYFKDVKLREDIHCFARILNLMAHFEDGQDYQLEYQIKSTFHFIGKMNDQQQVQKEIFNFLRRSGKITPDELKGEFTALYDRLEKLNENQYERRPFLYLDILSYLKARIENRPVDEIVRDKFKTLK